MCIMLMLQFLGTLLDSNSLIRSATRKILKLVKLSNIELFRLSFDSLIENLEKHPQVCFAGLFKLPFFPHSLFCYLLTDSYHFVTG